MRAVKINIPNPSPEQVDYYLRLWNKLENYHLQEDALDKLFFTLCPKNVEMPDILLKICADECERQIECAALTLEIFF